MLKTKRYLKYRRNLTFKTEFDGYVYLILTVKQTYNNFFIILTDFNGGRLYKMMSGGASLFRGTKRRTPAAAEVVAEKFLTGIEQEFKSVWKSLRIIVVFKSKPNIIFNTVMNVFVDSVLPIYMFLESKKVPHNGMRGRKIRRI